VDDRTRKDLCLTCHTGPLSAKWHGGDHEQAGLNCTDCHKPHHPLDPRQAANLAAGQTAGLPMPMAINQAVTCIQCHQEARQLVELADPHQVGGANNFQCSTCHDPHGKLVPESRRDLCLTCHNDAPTQAWHSSVHHLQGVACTDCHNPHPDPKVQPNVDIRHANIRRPQRIPMAVNDPDTCYKCHPQIYAMTLMPSHHPIFEGKMVCSSCHDSHGQALKLLNEPQTNLVCYKCHSQYQGPFVYEHPPVTQDCSICHNPHGAVQNNLLHQPTTFLCLRCHSGHRNGPPFHDAGQLPDIGKSQALQRSFYADCTQCHSQVHGSDVPSPNNAHALGR
jgi:DmsE family decaheme c-type cytochrome